MLAGCGCGGKQKMKSTNKAADCSVRLSWRFVNVRKGEVMREINYFVQKSESLFKSTFRFSINCLLM